MFPTHPHPGAGHADTGDEARAAAGRRTRPQRRSWGGVLTAALACAMVSGCAAPTVLVTAPAERALRPRRLFVLLALGPEVTPRHLAATTRAWRALGDELQVRGFDFVALAETRSRGPNHGGDGLADALEDRIGGIDAGAYDELVLVTSPVGTCVWSTWRHRGVLGPELEPARVSLHVELRPAWVRRRGARAGHVAAPSCAANTATGRVAARRLEIHLIGRSPRDGAANTSIDAAQGEIHSALDVALDDRAFGGDLVLLIDEIFAAREGEAQLKIDLRRVTR